MYISSFWYWIYKIQIFKIRTIYITFDLLKIQKQYCTVFRCLAEFPS